MYLLGIGKISYQHQEIRVYRILIAATTKKIILMERKRREKKGKEKQEVDEDIKKERGRVTDKESDWKKEVQRESKRANKGKKSNTKY